MTAWFRAGFVLELVGLAYFLMYLTAMRGRRGERFTRRTKVLTLLAALAMVSGGAFTNGDVPVITIVVCAALVIAAIASTLADRRRPQ